MAGIWQADRRATIVRRRPTRLWRQSRRSTLQRAGLVAAMTVLVAGCYQNPDPTAWGPVAKANFVRACSTEVVARGGTTTSIAIATPTNCRCVYAAMVQKYNLSWDAMKAYESRQASAKAGAPPPTPPKALSKAIADCREQGPAGS